MEFIDYFSSLAWEKPDEQKSRRRKFNDDEFEIIGDDFDPEPKATGNS